MTPRKDIPVHPHIEAVLGLVPAIWLGLLIGEMHRTYGLHGDLKWNNFLVSRDAKKIITIDLDGCQALDSFDLSACQKDLDRFLRDLRGMEQDTSLEKLFMTTWSKRVR